MISFTELQLVVSAMGEELREHLSTKYPWLPVVVITAFSVTNSIRVFAYIPQILKAATDQNGATAISFTTWGLFFLSHLTTIAYAVVQLADLVMALIFFGNAAACLTILVIAALKRKHYLRCCSEKPANN